VLRQFHAERAMHSCHVPDPFLRLPLRRFLSPPSAEELGGESLRSLLTS